MACFRVRRLQVQNPVSLKISAFVGLTLVKSDVTVQWDKCPPAAVVLHNPPKSRPSHWFFGIKEPLVRCGNLEREVSAQMSSSSSDCGSELRGPSQKSLRVASKRDNNKTKTELVGDYRSCRKVKLIVHNYSCASR
ncbi:hypothetical protein AVEN_183649-1 [Araneus ventricosus]|uniref:Uncharacterized protein n=1 Tax=Araneus ventricosus TaxID=182803 RepID=A0A4Y2I2T8_ARAVE|nr:hypothetical protein AVEN_183649-1 [Araneus ventricosus]